MSASSLAQDFNIFAARDVLEFERFKRFQDLRGRVGFLQPDKRPLIVLFISHRWETLEHPDPTCEQLEALQAFLRLVARAVHASLAPQAKRLELVPALEVEGALQAQELARRILGYGPFCLGDDEEPKRARVLAKVLKELGGLAFEQWVLARLGVWYDYCCMPQAPLSEGEALEFESSLAALGDFVQTATLVALRAGEDGYPQRAWCAAEFFLASGRSFARALFLDSTRFINGKKLAIVDGPQTDGGSVNEVIQQSYDRDRQAFDDECEGWRTQQHALAHLPNAWSEYRSLQGSSYYSAHSDPNPFRRLMQMVRALELRLLQEWLMADRETELDLSRVLADGLRSAGLSCSDPRDLLYLGLLSMSHCWVEPLRSLFATCLKKPVWRSGSTDATLAPLRVRLQAPSQSLRQLMNRAERNRAATWHSELSSRAQSDLTKQVLRHLEREPLGYAIIP